MKNRVIVIDNTGSEPLINGRPLTTQEKEDLKWSLGEIDKEAEAERTQFLEMMKRKDKAVSIIKDVKTGLPVGHVQVAPQGPQTLVRPKIIGTLDPSTLDPSKTVLRLADGSYVTARRGRRPEGSTVYREANNANDGANKAPGLDNKPKVMVRLADGSIVPRGRGRPPKGSVVVK
jgi:hypothetical protein